MVRAIIIDDEPKGINTLKLLIEKYTSGLTIVATATESEEGIAIIEEHKPEVIFLDLSMPKLSGFGLLQRLNYKNFKLVFTTAHEEYALKEIKNEAYEYLLKPIDIDELKVCLKKIFDKIQREKYLG